MSKTSSLVSSIALLIASVLMLGLGILWLLEMIGLSEISRGLIASQSAIAILALALFRFKIADFLEILKVKWKLNSIGHILLAVFLVITVNVTIATIIQKMSLDTNKLDEFTSNTTEAIINNGSIVVLFLIPVIVAPILEELAFRAGFKKILVDNSKWKPYQYVIISSILFGLLHWQPGAFSIYPIIVTTSMGVIHSIIYLRTNNIFIPIVSHMLYNLIVVSVSLML